MLPPSGISPHTLASAPGTSGSPVGARRRPSRAGTTVRQRGASAVEFALVMPVLTALLLGIVEFGNAYFVQASVAAAARTGVRSYAINYAQPNADYLAATAARYAVPDPSSFVSASIVGTCRSGAQTTMLVTYRYRSLTGMFDRFIGSDVTVVGKGSMQCGG